MQVRMKRFTRRVTEIFFVDPTKAEVWASIIMLVMAWWMLRPEQEFTTPVFRRMLDYGPQLFWGGICALIGAHGLYATYVDEIEHRFANATIRWMWWLVVSYMIWTTSESARDSLMFPMSVIFFAMSLQTSFTLNWVERSAWGSTRR